MWLSHKRGRAQTHGRRDGDGPSSGWLGDGQRACSRAEAGETGAAEPGQAETGPADQATKEHARIESRSTRAGEWRRKGKQTHSHQDRGRQASRCCGTAGTTPLQGCLHDSGLPILTVVRFYAAERRDRGLGRMRIRRRWPRFFSRA